MKLSKTPIVATWLLENFLSNSADTALKGDLVERYARGRSRTWYWKQVISAIVIGCWKDVSAHKLLALRALGIGFAILYLETWLRGYIAILWIRLLHGSPSFMVFPFPRLTSALDRGRIVCAPRLGYSSVPPSSRDGDGVAFHYVNGATALDIRGR